MDPDNDAEKSRFGGEQGWPRWMIGVLVVFILGALLLPGLLSTSQGTDLAYGDYMNKLQANAVKESTFDNTNGHITGPLVEGSAKFQSNGPVPPTDAVSALMTSKGVKFSTPEPGLLV